MNLRDALQRYDVTNRLSSAVLREKSLLSGITINNPPVEITEKESYELVRAYRILWKLSGVDPLPKLYFQITDKPGFALYSPLRNTITIHNYCYENFTQAALIGVLAHELGHARYRFDHEKMQKEASSDPEAVLKRHLGWNSREIFKQSHRLAAGKLRSRGVHMHEVGSDIEHANGGFAKRVKDMADPRQYYPSTVKQMALSVVSALQEIEADSFAQQLIGADWAARFEKELEILLKHDRLPMVGKWQALQKEFCQQHGIGRHAPWWMIDPHLPDTKRVRFMHELESFTHRTSAYPSR